MKQAISNPEISSIQPETKKVIECKVGDILSELGYR